MRTPSPPTVDLVAPNGRRVTVAPASPDDRVGALADALGVDRHRPLAVDGRPVARSDTLVGSGLGRGSRLDAPAPLRPAVVTTAAAVPVRSPGSSPVRAPAAVAAPAAGEPAVELVVEAGPASGARARLSPGRHVVGRSPAAALTIEDPALETHHGIVEVTATGAVVFTQLTGRVPCRLGGEPVAGPTAAAPGDLLLMGSSRVRIGPVPPVAGRAALCADPTDPWRRTLHRTPRVQPRWDPAPIPLPAATEDARRPGGTGLLAAGTTMIGSLAVALVMRQPLFLLFGAVGLVGASGVWLGGRVGAARDARRQAARYRRDLAAFAAAVRDQHAARHRHHLAASPPAAEAVAVALATGDALWARRRAHGDAFDVTLGWGPVTWDVAVDSSPGAATTADVTALLERAGRFADAPVAASLGPGAALAVTGAGAAGVVRALVVQIAAWVGPADWRLAVVVDDPGPWEWCAWLPHAAGAGVVAADDHSAVAALIDALADGGADRHVVLVTDRPDLLALRTGAVRRFVGATPSVAVVVQVPPVAAVPALCTSLLEIGSIGTGRWRADASSPAAAVPVHVAGVTEGAADTAARALARLHDPEDEVAGAGALPASVTLSELWAHHGPHGPHGPHTSLAQHGQHGADGPHGPAPVADAAAIAATWRHGGPDPAPVATVGLTADGAVAVDLARDGPHALVAGTTGSGKSELLRTLVVALATRCSPDHLNFVLVDYKGGATFDACTHLPHTVGVVTDLDDHLAARALASLEAEIRRRERVLRDAGAADLTQYRAAPGRAPLARLAVIIDEFAALAAELPEFLAALVGIAQRGRSLGLHLVLATQRPAGVVSDDIRANTNLRLALRLTDDADARDVVGDGAPARFPRHVPGRTMLRLGPGETVVFQAARCTAPLGARGPNRLRVVDHRDPPADGARSELDVLVRAIRAAATATGTAAPHRPWLPPLPARVVVGAPDAGRDDVVAPGDAGLVDVPDEQRREPLRWSAGNLALLGASGSGLTSAVLAVVAAACHGSTPAERHVYAVDGRGGGRLDAVARLAHCGGVVRLHERERLDRLLRDLGDELDRRRAAGGCGARPDVIVAVDGVAALRSVLDRPADPSAHEQFVRLVQEGPPAGIRWVLAADRPHAVAPAVLAACAERWVFHLDDPGEARSAGVAPGDVPPATPGRCTVASTGHAAQVALVEIAALPSGAPTRQPDAGGDAGPPPVRTLPRVVDVAGLPPGSATPAGDTELVVGADYHSLGPARLAVADGEHVLVAGPPRSGRSTALARLAASWRQAHPGGAVHVVCPVARSPLAGGPDVVAAGDLVARVAAVPLGRPCLVVVDDAERLADDSGQLGMLVADRRPGVLVMAGGRPDALRTLYGHWTTVVRRSRLGLLLAQCADIDGDVLGELLPRHPPLAPRPGLAWVIDSAGRALVQIGCQPTGP